MHRLRMFASRLKELVSCRFNQHEFDEEMRVHVELLTERYIRQGLTAAEAHILAMRQFGVRPSRKSKYMNSARPYGLKIF